MSQGFSFYLYPVPVNHRHTFVTTCQGLQAPHQPLAMSPSSSWLASDSTLVYYSQTQCNRNTSSTKSFRSYCLKAEPEAGFQGEYYLFSQEKQEIDRVGSIRHLSQNEIPDGVELQLVFHVELQGMHCNMKLVLKASLSFSPHSHWLWSVPRIGMRHNLPDQATVDSLRTITWERFQFHALSSQQHQLGSGYNSPGQKVLARTLAPFTIARNIFSEQDREFDQVD